jgi:ribonuclease P/MRP protein subunit RPP40
MEGDK